LRADSQAPPIGDEPFNFDRRRVLLGLGAVILSPACKAGCHAHFSTPNLGAGPLVAAKPESVDMSSAGIAEVFARIDARIQAGRFPGATAMICRRGKIVGEHAAGKRARG